MEKYMNNLLVFQSGGPTAVINASLAGVIKEAKNNKNIDNVLGSVNGIEGIFYNNIKILNELTDEELELLKVTPAAYLGSARYQLKEDISNNDYLVINEFVKKNEIKYICIIGGNDSMDTVNKLSIYFKSVNSNINVMGVPKTVDNDLAETDHSNGFGSAAKYIVNTVREIIADAVSYDYYKAYIIEVMGRNAGWLTAAVDLLPENARPDLIYLPENKFDANAFVDKVGKIYKEKGICIAVVSEGIEFERDEANVKVDSFGHKQLGGAALDLSKMVKNKFGISMRAIELSLPQRTFAPLTSKVDSEEAIACGTMAVRKACEGLTGQMIAIKRVSTYPYKSELVPVDISKIANVERKIPQSMMKDDTRMDQSFRDYCLPLIEGEIPVKYENGIIKTCVLKKVII